MLVWAGFSITGILAPEQLVGPDMVDMEEGMVAMEGQQVDMEGLQVDMVGLQVDMEGIQDMEGVQEDMEGQMVDMEGQQVHIVDMVIEDPAPVGIEHMEASSVQEDMETPIGDKPID